MELPVLIKKTLTFSVVTFLVLISAAVLYSSFASRWQQPKYPVIIAVSKTPLSTPFYVAKAIGSFDDTCVSVEFDQVVGGQRAFAKVMSGEADLGTSSDSVIAFQSLTKKAFVTHATFVQSNNDVKLISRTSAKINSTIDLKGKRVGITQGTASEYFLSTLLALEGLTTEDVRIFHYTPEELEKGFLDNEIDAFVPWEPFGFYSTQLLTDQIKIHDTKGLNILSFNLISATADNLLVEKAKCVIQGLSLAIDYISSHPVESKNIVMNELNISAEFLEWVWPDYIFKLGLNQSLMLSVESQAVWAVSTQMSQFEEVPRVELFIDSRALLQVMPNAVNISQ